MKYVHCGDQVEDCVPGIQLQTDMGRYARRRRRSWAYLQFFCNTLCGQDFSIFAVGGAYKRATCGGRLQQMKPVLTD